MENETRFDVLTNFFGTSFLSETIPSNSNLPTEIPLTDRSITSENQNSKIINAYDYFMNSFDQPQQQQQQTTSSCLFDSNDLTFQSLELNYDNETNEKLKHLYESIKETKKIWKPFYDGLNERNNEEEEDETCFEVDHDDQMMLDNELDSISDYLVEMSKK